MNIFHATRDYEAWLGRHVALYGPELDHKHAEMASKGDPLPFFRGTYYRWAQRWQERAGRWNKAPRVLAVGDAHVGNFGTWRDSDGRLVWGVNDFDEADELPYTNDLTRLAASAWAAKSKRDLPLSRVRMARAILRGYHGQLTRGPRPFVLEEHHAALRSLAMAAERDPKKFWKRLGKTLDQPPVKPPPDARNLLLRSLPGDGDTVHFRFHARVGMGSLGKPRYVALQEWRGAWVAREAKAVAPPATAWLARFRSAAADGDDTETGNPQAANLKSRVPELLAVAVRCPDPFFLPGAQWTVRRLAPRCSRIDLETLCGAKRLEVVLEAMGGELANLHGAAPRTRAAILRDLDRRGKGWLETAAGEMLEFIEDDWRTWRRHE
jgi:hypothetical protein